MYYNYGIRYILSLQSIGFIGPGVALIGLTMAKTPMAASAWLTLAVGLKSFSHSGFLVNLQVGYFPIFCKNNLRRQNSRLVFDISYFF